MTIDSTRWKTLPLPHQVDGVRWLLADDTPRREAPVAALFDRMGSGKSKQVVDAANELWTAGAVDTVVVLCPAAVRFGWADAQLGQVALHSWVPTTCQVLTSEDDFIPEGDHLRWLVVSYDWARTGWYPPKARQPHGKAFAWLRRELAGRQVCWVADESHRLQTHNSVTTRALTALRDELGGRAVALSGTPMGNRYLLSLWGQLRWLDRRVLPYQNFYHYRARYCQMGGYHGKQVLKYFDTAQLAHLLEPYVLRRTDVRLPMKTYRVLEVPLDATTWKLYRQMRDEAVAWLSAQPADRSVAVNGLTQVLRLSQLTSGLLGGLGEEHARSVSTEKQDFLLRWLDELGELGEPRRVVVWARWRDEVPRLRRALKLPSHTLVGNQPAREREATLRELLEGSGECVVVGQPQAGGTGTNAPTFRRQVFLSHVEALLDRQQAEDRLVRANSHHDQVEVVDLLATGPAGQRTVDHKIYKATRAGVELHAMTMAQWRQALTEE